MLDQLEDFFMMVNQKSGKPYEYHGLQACPWISPEDIEERSFVFGEKHQ
jgi:hypothetical protein